MTQHSFFLGTQMRTDSRSGQDAAPASVFFFFLSVALVNAVIAFAFDFPFSTGVAAITTFFVAAVFFTFGSEAPRTSGFASVGRFFIHGFRQVFAFARRSPAWTLFSLFFFLVTNFGFEFLFRSGG